MNKKQRRTTKRLFNFETVLILIITALTVSYLFNNVDLVPYVDNDFFFSSEDPNYQADNEITQLFTRKDSQII